MLPPNKILHFSLLINNFKCEEILSIYFICDFMNFCKILYYIILHICFIYFIYFFDLFYLIIYFIYLFILFLCFIYLFLCQWSINISKINVYKYIVEKKEWNIKYLYYWGICVYQKSFKTFSLFLFHLCAIRALDRHLGVSV